MKAAQESWVRELRIAAKSAAAGLARLAEALRGLAERLGREERVEAIIRDLNVAEQSVTAGHIRSADAQRAFLESFYGGRVG